MDTQIWRNKILNALELPSYNNLLEDALSNVPNNIDKRQGSIVHMVISSMCMKLEDIIMESAKLHLEGNTLTSTGVNLEIEAESFGVYRKAPTKARGIIVTEPENIEIPNGTRFFTKHTQSNVMFTSLDKTNYNSGEAYRVKSDTAGDIGNIYIGELLPVDYVDGLLKVNLVEIDVVGTDEESDEDLRDRLISKKNQQSFAGNISYYKEIVEEYDYVSGVQVYPAWNGGGTVKLSVVNKQYEPISNNNKNELKADIDPLDNQGNGMGKAPIGHVVTIVAPTKVDINVTCTLSLIAGAVKSTVVSKISDGIEEYIREIQNEWDKEDAYGNYSSVIYLSKINSIIASEPEAINATDVKINNQASDLILTQNATTQNIPSFVSFTA